MSLIQSWWDWCTESFGHMFLGVTAPILILAALFVILTVNGDGGNNGLGPQPPRSDVAGVCVNTTPPAAGSGDCVTSTAGGSFALSTATPVPPTATPAPRTYTVKSGDTLYSICAAEAPDMGFDACVNAIVDLSELSGPDEITEGQALRLPAGARATSGSTPTASTSNALAPTATPEVVFEPEPEEVEEEEAEPTPAASLVALGPANTGSEDDDDATEAEATPEAPDSEEDTIPEERTTPSDAELGEAEGTEYTVEDGDSLLGICVAQVPDMPEDECIEFVVLLNDLTGPDEIRSGQVLILP